MSLEEALAANTAAVRALTAALDRQSAAPAAVETPKAAAKVKADAQAASDAAAKAIIASNTPPSTATPDPAKGMVYQDIQRPFLDKFIKTLGVEAGKKLLADFGVPAGGKLSAIAEAQWPAVLATMNQRLAEAERAAEEGSLG